MTINTLFRLAELADRLRVHPRTIMRWRDSGELPVIRHGGIQLFDIADVEKFITKHKSPRKS